MKIKAKRVRGLRKFTGLMFRTRKTEPLFFDFGKDEEVCLHSFFVFFKFRIILISEDLKRIEDKVMKPFELIMTEPYRYIIEVPL